MIFYQSFQNIHLRISEGIYFPKAKNYLYKKNSYLFENGKLYNFNYILLFLKKTYYKFN
jgi:hypothetical protein